MCACVCAGNGLPTWLSSEVIDGVCRGYVKGCGQVMARVSVSHRCYACVVVSICTAR